MMIIVWWLYDDLIIREATIIAGFEVPHDTLADYSCEQGLVKPFMYDHYGSHHYHQIILSSRTSSQCACSNFLNRIVRGLYF